MNTYINIYTYIYIYIYIHTNTHRLPPLKIPVLEILSSQGAGIFDTTFCDDQLRITRGDRGEIRIFTKA